MKILTYLTFLFKSSIKKFLYKFVLISNKIWLFFKNNIFYIFLIFIIKVAIKNIPLLDSLDLPFLNTIYCEPTDNIQNNNITNSKVETTIETINTTESTVKNPNVEIHHHTHFKLDTAVKNITDIMDKNISQAIGQVGLSASIIGGMTVGASISAGQSPLTRAAVASSVGLIAGGLQVGFSAANRFTAEIQKNKNPNISVNDTPPSPTDTNFVSSFNEPSLIENLTSNPIDALISSLFALNIANLILIIVLFLTFISKIILSLNYELNWVDKLLPLKYSSKIKFYILKILNFYSKLRDFNIIMIIIIMIINNLGIVYLFSILFNNLDEMCELYLKYKNS